MKANYLRPQQQAKVSRKAMASYLQRATVDEHIDKRIKEHEEKRLEELTAFAGAVDANWLYTLHKELHFGKRRLRRAWEAAIRNRISFREFYRDGHSKYEEKPTGQNVEDEATVQTLLSIGVDIRAWEAEPIIIDRESGAVSFGKTEGAK